MAVFRLVANCTFFTVTKTKQFYHFSQINQLHRRLRKCKMCTLGLGSRSPWFLWLDFALLLSRRWAMRCSLCIGYWEQPWARDTGRGLARSHTLDWEPRTLDLLATENCDPADRLPLGIGHGNQRWCHMDTTLPLQVSKELTSSWDLPQFTDGETET